MTRVGVFSDSHGDTESLELLLRMMGHVDAVCFLGDVAGDAEYLGERLGAQAHRPPLFAVRGNNDYWGDCGLPWERVEKIGGVKVHLEHGHRRGLQALRYLALEEGARIALFGHTHYPYCEENGGVLLLNPGSAGNYCRGGRARAALLEIDGESVSVKQYML